MSEAPRKKGSKRYHTFDAFRADLDIAVTKAKQEQKLASIRDQLKRRIDFPIHVEHVEETSRIINEYPEHDLLHFSIVCDAEFGRTSSALLKKIASTVVEDARSKTEYPATLGTDTREGPIASLVRHWLEKLKRPPTTSSDDVALDVAAARTALMCLFPDIRMPFFPQVAIEILESCIKQPVPKKAHPHIQDDSLAAFAKTIADCLALNRPQNMIIRTLAVAGTFFSKSSEQLSIDFERTARSLRNAQYDIGDLKSQVSRLEQSCLQKDKGIHSLQDQLNEAHARLLKEEERYRTSEEYWKDVSSRRRNEAVYKIKNYLNHEANEMRHCLDRESPNVRMAIERVNNIDKFLASLGNI